MTIKRVLTIAALASIAVASAVAQTPDPLLGTWKLNAAKSKAPYTSGTSVFEAAGDALKGTVDLVGTDGTKYHWTFSAKYDGKLTLRAMAARASAVRSSALASLGSRPSSERARRPAVMAGERKRKAVGSDV